MSSRHAFAVAGFLLMPALDIATPAAAAESSIELIAGGLAFAGNPSIKIEQQQVLIARDRIAITYTMHNISDTPQAITMAFSLPDIDAGTIAEDELALPAPDVANFVQSQTTADGQPVTPKLEQRAMALALDVTASLRDAGFDLFPFAAGNAGKLETLTPELRLDLLERGILKDDGVIIAPSWTVKTVAHWRQPFLAGQSITLVHTYRPVVSVAARDDEAISMHRKRSCLTPAHETALATLPVEGGVAPTLTTIGFAASQAAETLGPIGRLRLIVETSDASAVVATCKDGLRRTGPMQLEWSATDSNFDEDFHVMIAR